jgi:prevent-host-death family protein
MRDGSGWITRDAVRRWWRLQMREVGAHEASRFFSRLLREAEAGERFVITRRGKPVATLGPYRRPEAVSAQAEMTAEERRAAVERAIAMMEEGLPIAADVPRPPFTRDGTHER